MDLHTLLKSGKKNTLNYKTTVCHIYNAQLSSTMGYQFKCIQANIEFHAEVETRKK